MAGVSYVAMVGRARAVMEYLRTHKRVSFALQAAIVTATIGFCAWAVRNEWSKAEPLLENANLGYVALALATTDSPANARQAIELVSGKLGVVLLVLGGLHFFNLYVIHRLHHRAGHPTKRYVDHILD